MNYWGDPDASVSFCEEKYNEVFWIAEYYNTLTSLFYIGVGLFFVKTKVSDIAWGIIGIGVGSIILHATMRYYGQWFDEIAMITTCFKILQYLNPKIPRFLKYIFIAVYLWFHHIFIVFFLTFSFLKLYLMYVGLTSDKDNIYVKIYISFFVIGFICWTLDQLACDYVQSYNLHAWWHIFSACSILFALIILVSDKKKLK